MTSKLRPPGRVPLVISSGLRATRQIIVIFYGKTAGGSFEYYSFIDPEGPLSEELKMYVRQLE